MAMDFGKSKNASKLSQMQQKMITDSNAPISKALPLDVIVENEDNELIYNMDKLDDLIETIEEDGFTDPIGVYDLKNGKYEIFSGHKRYRAMMKKGEKTIPANIFPMPKSSSERARRLIKSNSLNRDYSPLTQAKELKYFYDNVIVPENKPGKKRLQLAEEFGMSEGQVAKLLALLNLIPELQEMANNKDLAFSAFSPAAQLEEEKQKELYKMIFETKAEDGSFSITRTEINRYIKKLQGVEEESSSDNNHISTEKTTDTPSEETNNSNNNSEIKAEEKSNKVILIEESETEEEKSINLTDVMNTPVVEEKSTEENRTNINNVQVEAPVAKMDIDFVLKTELQNLKRIDIRNMRVVDKEAVAEYLEQIKEIIKNIEKTM